MGTGETYSACDAVMAALSIKAGQAFEWLRDMLGIVDDDTSWMESITVSAPRVVEHIGREAHTSPFTWDDREANAAIAADWLVKNLFLRVGVHLLWGQSASGKSFVALELARCIATGEPFFGHRIKAPGGVLFALGEGAGSMPNRLDALRIGKLHDHPPVSAITGEPLDIDRLPVAWLPVDGLSEEARFRQFADKVRLMAREMPARHGCPLRLIIVDTVVASFGFDEDPDSAKVTDALKSKLASVAEELGVCVIAVHHAGKSKEAGEYGSYAWRASVETSIEIDAKRDEVGHIRERRLVVRKNRHGTNEGWNQVFELQSITLGVDDDGEPIESAIVVPTGHRHLSGSRMTQSAPRRAGPSRILEAMETALAHSAQVIEHNDGTTIAAVSHDDLKREYALANPGEHVDRNFRRDLDLAKAGLDLIPEERDGQRMYWMRQHANDNAGAIP